MRVTPALCPGRYQRRNEAVPMKGCCHPPKSDTFANEAFKSVRGEGHRLLHLGGHRRVIINTKITFYITYFVFVCKLNNTQIMHLTNC